MSPIGVYCAILSVVWGQEIMTREPAMWSTTWWLAVLCHSWALFCLIISRTHLCPARDRLGAMSIRRTTFGAMKSARLTCDTPEDALQNTAGKGSEG